MTNYIYHLQSHIKSQYSLLTKQAEQLRIQTDRIVHLEKKSETIAIHASKAEGQKSSQNSKLAPSKDLFVAKNKSLRKPIIRKTGGQLGHKRYALEMNSNPDFIFDLKNDYCLECGNKLEGVSFTLKAKRQVIDIPSIHPLVYRGYRQYSCACANCDHKQVAGFPTGVNAPIQYGCHIEALVSYFSVFQCMPYARMKSMFFRLFGLALSEGSIQNMLQKAAAKAQGCYE